MTPSASCCKFNDISTLSDLTFIYNKKLKLIVDLLWHFSSPMTHACRTKLGPMQLEPNQDFTGIKPKIKSLIGFRTKPKLIYYRNRTTLGPKI